jgi:hypothetical protein
MRLLGALLIVFMVLTGCRQSQQQAAATSDLQIDLITEPNPPTTGEGMLLISVHNPDGSLADVERIDVRGDMNHAGMQPVFSGADTAENGVYSVAFNWTMGGDWILDVTVWLADDSTTTQRFEITVETS